jgi:hypothetical protein
MREVVEAAVGRSVIAVLSTAHHDPDVMAAVFLLEPLGGSGSGEAGRWGAGDSPAPHRPLHTAPRTQVQGVEVSDAPEG